MQEASAEIVKLSRGYIFKVGCKTVAVINFHEAMQDLEAYISGNHAEKERVYRKWFPEDFEAKQAAYIRPPDADVCEAEAERPTIVGR